MKGSTEKPSRGIWSEAENYFLAKLTTSQRQIPWKEVARLINGKCGGNKSGKQCRERFRNYIDSRLEKTPWQPNEKLLFHILHQTHDNHWKEISRILNGRSDVFIKNYFCHIIRKVTKNVNIEGVDDSIMKTPEKFYRHFSLLTHVKEYYLPDVKNLSRLPRYSKAVLQLLLNRKITEEKINTYQELLIRSFKISFSTHNLPIEINLPLESFRLPKEKIKELNSLKHIFNTRPLNQLVLIRFNERNEESKSILNNNIEPPLSDFKRFTLSSYCHLLQPFRSAETYLFSNSIASYIIPPIAPICYLLRPAIETSIPSQTIFLNRDKLRDNEGNDGLH